MHNQQRIRNQRSQIKNDLEAAIRPRTGDSKRDPGCLRVEEQPAAIGAVGRPGKLPLAEVSSQSISRRVDLDVVTGEPKDLPVARQAVDARRRRPILADCEPSARTERKVVRHVEDRRAWRLEHQSKPIASSIDLPDLSHPGIAAIGCRHVKAAIAKGCAFEARERGATGLDALLENTEPVTRIRVQMVRSIWIRDVHPSNVVSIARALSATRVETTASVDREHLQPSTVRQSAARPRDVAVQPSLTGVLGFIDNGGLRVDGNRFVNEAAHRLDRFGVGYTVVWDLEDVPVLERKWILRILRAQDRFLAGQPRAPRRRPSRAIADRA